MFFKKKIKRKRSWWKLKLTLFLFCALGMAVVGNAIYQVWRKPSEIVGLLDSKFHKAPQLTWATYGSDFRQSATNILTADFLAALAQAESNANPVARTYWKWRWTSNWRQMFAPASSAVGMFQITDGTYAEAKDFCIADGEVRQRSTNAVDAHCVPEFMYSRLIPSHAIEMTAARLHHHVRRLLSAYRVRTATRLQQQTLATIIHLCGVGKGEQLVQARFELRRIGRCGDHAPAAYVGRVRALQKQFRQLAAQAQTVADR